MTLPALCQAALHHLPALMTRFVAMGVDVMVTRTYSKTTGHVTLAFVCDPQSDTLLRDEAIVIAAAYDWLVGDGFYVRRSLTDPKLVLTGYFGEHVAAAPTAAVVETLRIHEAATVGSVTVERTSLLGYTVDGAVLDLAETVARVAELGISGAIVAPPPAAQAAMPIASPVPAPTPGLVRTSTAFGTVTEQWVKGPAGDHRVRQLRGVGFAVTTRTVTDRRALWTGDGAAVTTTEIRYSAPRAWALAA